MFPCGVDNQHALALDGVEALRRERAANIATLRRAKGFLVAPCHNIHTNTPSDDLMVPYYAVAQFGTAGTDPDRRKGNSMKLLPQGR